MILRTVGLIVALAFGILDAPHAAEAQPAKTPRLGILATTSPAAPGHLLQAFLGRLRELGYVEGQNIAIEYRWAEGKLDRLPSLAAELVRSGVDVIFAHNTPAIHAAKRATESIPIVMGASADPVVSGFVQSLARPGGNITGPTTIVLELTGKQLELIREIVPNLSRVAVLWTPAVDWHKKALKDAEAAGRALGVKVQAYEARGPQDYEGAFSAMVKWPAGALLVLSNPIAFTERARLADLAAKKRLPAIFEFREAAEAGGLVTYGTNIPDVFRRAADYVDKILKGAKPADLPVEQPTRFELIVNLKTAKALGLTIPQTILIRADHVIQ